MRFNSKNMTPGQYIKMYRRGGSIKKYQDGSEMEPGMYDPEANIYSPDWQMDENVQLYEEPTEETIPTEENTNADLAATEVVCQMCDGGYPVNLPPNPDGTCPPGSIIDDGQTNPCDPNQPGSADDSDIQNQDPNNQDSQSDVKSGHRQKHGSKGTIPDWLTAFPAGDKGNLLDLALTARSIVNSYKPENYKGGKFSLLNLPTGQEGGEEGGPAPLEADYNFINAGGCKGGGCADNPYVDSGASGFVGVEGSNLDDALLQGGLKSHVGYTGGSGLGVNASGELGAQTNLMAATEGAMDPELFYKGKVSAGYTGDPIMINDAQYTGANIGGFGEYDSNSGVNLGIEGGYGPVSVRGGYNVDTGSPFLGAGLNVKFRDGGDLPKAQTGYFDHYEESDSAMNWDTWESKDPFSFGVGQSYDGEGGYYSKKGAKILTYDELNAYISGSQARNGRNDFINSERPNVILTHENAADWFDNRANWTRVDRPGWEEDVKQKIYSGNWGLNPATGALVKLDNVGEDRGGGNVDVHPDKKIIATKEYHDAGWTRLPSDPAERNQWLQDNKDDIITITWVHQGDVSTIGRHLDRKKITAEDIELGGNNIKIPGLETESVYMENSPNQDGYFQALTRSGLNARKSMLSEKGQWEFDTNIDYDSYQDVQFKLDSLMSDPNADPLEIINLKLELLNNPENVYKDSSITTPYQSPNQNLMDTSIQMDNTYQHSNAPILSLQPGGELESDVSTSITLDEEGARPRIDASYPIANTVDSGYQGCYTSPTGEVSAACEIEGGVELDPSTSTTTTPDQVNEYTVPTGNQPYSDQNVYDADGDGVITPNDAIYAQNNPLPTEETVTETIPGTTKTNLSMNPKFNLGLKGSLGYTSPGGLHIGGTGRAGITGTGTQDVTPYYSARGDVGYLNDNYSLTGFGEHGNMTGTDVGLRGSADLGGVDLYGEGRYNIDTGSPSFMAGVRIPLGRPGRKMGGTTPSWAIPQLQTGGSSQGGYMWEWSPENPDPLLMNNQQMIGPQNQTSAPPNQELPAANPVVPPMQDADSDGISDFVDADSGSEPVYGPENTAQPESNIEPGTYDPDIYTFNQPELDEAVDTQDDTEYYEPEDTTPPDANDDTDSSEFPFDDSQNATDTETDPGMDDTTDDTTEDGTDENTDEAVNPDEGDTSDTQEDGADTSSEDDDSGAVDEGGGGKKKGRGFGETVTKTAENIVKGGKFLNAWMERRNAKKEKEKLMHKTIADNMFEADESDISGQKGDYDTNSGIFRPDDKVSTVRKGRYGGALPMFQIGNELGSQSTQDPFHGYNYDTQYWNEPGTHNYGKTENYANWYSGGDGHGSRVLDSEGNPTNYKKGAWEGHYSGQQWNLKEPLNFSEKDYNTLINTMQYNPKLLDRKGQTRRIKDDFSNMNTGPGPKGSGTYDHNRHIDDYVAFKEVMERNSGHEWNDMQLADAAYALKKRGTRGGWGSGVNQQGIFAPGLPTASAYRNDPSVWSDYGDAIYADRIENPGGIPENSTMDNANNIVQANTTTQPTRNETPVSLPAMPINQLETAYVPELQQPTQQEVVEEESAYVPQSQRGEYVPQSQRNQDPVEEVPVEEESEDDVWARRKAKRAAMFARDGGQVVDIDFEMYKELIAAGAEIEIV